jgi:hypothetical protein
MRRLRESYSDVILRLVELRGWTAGPLKGRPLEGRNRPEARVQDGLCEWAERVRKRP